MRAVFSCHQLAKHPSLKHRDEPPIHAFYPYYYHYHYYYYYYYHHYHSSIKTPDSARPRTAIHNNTSTPCPTQKNCTTRRDGKGPKHRHHRDTHTMTRTNTQTAKSITRGIRHQPIE
jgi:hypothetical protein